MNRDFELQYDNGSEQLTFSRRGEFWLTAPPDFSSVQVEISDAQTAGQVGSAITGQSVRPKSVTLTGAIVGNAAANRERLLRVVAPGKTARLTYSCGGKSWYIEGAPSTTPVLSAGEVVQDFQIRFYAPYPFWKSTNENPFDIAGLESRFRFPFFSGGRWYISKFSGSFTNIFLNEGNVPMAFELHIYARNELAGPVLTHLGTGRHIRFNKTLTAGQTVVISTIYGQRGARLIDRDGSGENAFRWLSLDSDIAMEMQPGENLMHFDADYNRQGARVTIQAPRGVMSGV